jgi:integrase
VSTWTDKDGRRHVGIMLGGKRVHRILPKGATAGDAKQLEAELRAAVGRQRAPIIPGDPSLTAIMGIYLEHAKTLRSPETAAFHAARLGPWVEKYRASEAQKCAAHILKDMQGHYAAGTINRSLGALKKALALAWERGVTPENYGLRVKRLPEHNARDVTMTQAEVETLASHASEQVRAAIWIALFTGCRRGEILKMRRQDIGPDTILIRAGNTKTLKTRTVPIVGPVRQWLEYVPLKINAEGLKSGFRRAREAADMEHVTFHDLRRSCGSLLIAANVDLYVVSAILGHSTVAVTQKHYAHQKVGRLREGLEAAFGTAENYTGDYTGHNDKRPRRAA